MAWNDITSGAGTGSAIGGALGSIVPGIGTAIGTAAGGLLGGGLGGLLARDRNPETDMQKKQRELVDELLASLNGNGAYSSLFNPSEADFERSFAEPARARFRNVTAPQIQQQYIATGLQRGSGIEGALARAGVDMDQLLNEQYMNYVQGLQNNKIGAINQILGQGPGVLPQRSPWESISQGAAGYLSGPNFGNDIGNILSSINKQKDNQSESLQDVLYPVRKGFERDQQVYNPYTGVQQ